MNFMVTARREPSGLRYHRLMIRRALAPLLMVALAAVAGCGGSDDPPPSSPPATSGSDTVTGHERVGWVQTASDSDVFLLEFAGYIDGVRNVLTGAACTRNNSGSFDCSAALPPMTAGRHALEIAAFFTSPNGVVEGPRAPALQLTVASVVAEATRAADDTSSSFRASDGREVRAQRLADDLADPADVAVDSQGRAFVVERRGTLRIVSSNASGVELAEPLFGPRDEGARVLSVALAPDFATSRHLYTLSAMPSADGSRLFVTRYRELNGSVGEAAVVVSEQVRTTDPGGVLRFGPEQAMYVATADQSSGRILRFLADGRIPPDNPGASPLLSIIRRAPTGLAWAPDGAALWSVQHADGVDAIEVIAPQARTAMTQPTGALTGSAAGELPQGTRASGLAIVAAQPSPLDGGLIVSSIGLADLLHFDRRIDGIAGPPVRLLQGRFGAIAGVAAGPRGDLYFITANNERWGAGRDLLVRLALE
jgi:hypothetical protein